MDSLEYRRLAQRPAGPGDGHGASNGAAWIDWLTLLKRIAWVGSAAFLVWRWRLYVVPNNCYAYLAIASLAVFLSAFLYIVVSIRRDYGYSESAPPHGRWKHYAPQSLLVMSVAALVFYCFASVAHYPSQGILVFPGMFVVCYGGSCLLSYL